MRMQENKEKCMATKQLCNKNGVQGPQDAQ